MRVLGIGGGGLGKLGPGVGGKVVALSHKGRPSPQVASFFPTPPHKPPNDNVWKEVISGGDLFIVQPQDVKSKPEVGSSSPLPRLGREEEALTDTGKMCWGQAWPLTGKSFSAR